MHWFAVALVVVTGALHVYAGIVEARIPVALAGVGYGGALVLFFLTFCGILIYVFTGSKRKKRFDSYRYIPLDDEAEEAPRASEPAGQHQRKGNADDGK